MREAPVQSLSIHYNYIFNCGEKEDSAYFLHLSYIPVLDIRLIPSSVQPDAHYTGSDSSSRRSVEGKEIADLNHRHRRPSGVHRSRE